MPIICYVQNTIFNFCNHTFLQIYAFYPIKIEDHAFQLIDNIRWSEDYCHIMDQFGYNCIIYDYSFAMQLEIY